MTRRATTRELTAFKQSLREANVDIQALRVAASHWGTVGRQVQIRAIIREIEAVLDEQIADLENELNTNMWDDGWWEIDN